MEPDFLCGGPVALRHSRAPKSPILTKKCTWTDMDGITFIRKVPHLRAPKHQFKKICLRQSSFKKPSKTPFLTKKCTRMDMDKTFCTWSIYLYWVWKHQFKKFSPRQKVFKKGQPPICTKSAHCRIWIKLTVTERYFCPKYENVNLRRFVCGKPSLRSRQNPILGEKVHTNGYSTEHLYRLRFILLYQSKPFVSVVVLLNLSHLKDGAKKFYP